MERDQRSGAGTLERKDVGREVKLEGWVQKRRDFGELIFVDLRDRTGIAQVVFDRERGVDAASMSRAKELRSEFVLRVTGVVHERSAETRNVRMATGDVEVVAQNVEILNRSDTPPFQIEDQVTANEDLRLKHRYLDLRRAPLARNLVLRSDVSFKVRDYLHRNGFLEIETPILTRSTPEGARDFLVPSRVSKGEFYALPQSPQLFKQILMVSGLDRYYQIARCFRDEDLRADRQPEFTQIDIEASFTDELSVQSLIEGMFAEVFPVAGIEVPAPFPRMTWQEAMDRFGIDRPDTRFGMELIDLEDAVASSQFAPFRSALAENGLVRGIVVPGGAKLSRKRLDDLTAVAKQFGATGLIWMKFEAAEVTSSIRKFMTPGDDETFRSALRAGEGDLALIIAGDRTVVWDALGQLRLRVARDEGMIPENRWNFLWVVDFPLLEWDAEGKRWAARHHPFTSPRLDHLDRLESDPGGVLARAYDVVLNGLELGGGSIRINTPELQSRMFRALGISDEEARERFGFLLEAFRYGAPPHGGIALGLDRMVMVMARASSLRDVIAFPKTASGQDLMTDAPAAVDQAQLQDLGLELRRRDA
ncbi:MAG TPA: aspartate--tRNA ligase [Thermoanaerobaculia bacterium]|nr:aspartate--tRNA ligase [Thermoanaerobaculia bacterium]